MVGPEQGRPPIQRSGRTEMPTTGRIGQLALLQMKGSSSRLLPTTNNHVYAASPTDLSNMHNTFDSLNARESSYQGRMGRFSNPNAAASSNDQIQVRIRGKNNDVSRHTGSVTRTMGEIGEESKRRKEISKAANRLRMLEKLEDYREKKMNVEIA